MRVTCGGDVLAERLQQDHCEVIARLQSGDVRLQSGAARLHSGDVRLQSML